MDHACNHCHDTSVMEWSECTQNVASLSFGGSGTNDIVRNVGSSSNVNGPDMHRHHMNVMHLSHNSHSVGHHHAAAAPTIKNHSVTHFNGYLYCFGGYDGRRNHMTLLLYSIQQHRWIRPYHVNTSTTNKINGTTIQSQPIQANPNRPNQAFGGQSSGMSSLNNSSSNGAADLFRMDLGNVGGTGVNNGNAPSGTGSGTSTAGCTSSDSSSIIVQGTPPPGRNGHSATLATDPDDDEQGRIIIIGGWLGTGPLAASDMHVLDITHMNDDRSSSVANNNDMNVENYAGSLSRIGMPSRQVLQWYQPAVKGTPPGPCNMHSADYVINRKEVYVFRGGNGREYLNDLHALNVDTLTWRKVHCTGAIPQQRANHSSAILDHPNSRRSELFIFGGWNGFERLNDIHILDTETSNWTAPHVAGVLPHPRAGMTLTALRGRLYLFGGSGTSAKCFQDLQILDRHEMAWLDVVHVNEQPKGGNINNNSSNVIISGASVSNKMNRTARNNDFNCYDRLRFGGSRTYGRHDGLHASLIEDGAGTFSLGSSAGVEARLQREGLQEYANTSEYNSSSANNFWMNSSQSLPIDQNDQHDQHLGDGMMRDVAGPYSSPNPNDEDTVPSILIRGNGPGRRAGHTATAVNRKIYVFGGSCGSDYLNDFFVLDTDPPPSAVVTEANPLLLMEHRLRHFCNDPEFADVVFVVGDNKEKVYAHKMVLSIVSDCFRAMFTTGFKESAATEIGIPDCSYGAFLSVMEYIYSGHLPAHNLLVVPSANSAMTCMSTYNHNRQQQINQKSLTRVVEMLELADRFFLDHLKQVCESMLQLAVQFDTVEYLLAIAQKTNSLQLQAICQHFCRNHFRSPSPNHNLNNPNHNSPSDTSSESI